MNPSLVQDMKKPTALTVVQVIAWLQVFVTLAMAVVVVMCVIDPASDGFWLGLEESAVRGFSKAQDLKSFGAREQGQAAAYLVMSLVCPMGALVCIRKKARNGLTGFVAGGIVVAVGQGGLPLLQIVSLILVLRKSVSEYFGTQPKEPSKATL